jgi:hypothetical protein
METSTNHNFYMPNDKLPDNENNLRKKETLSPSNKKYNIEMTQIKLDHFNSAKDTFFLLVEQTNNRGNRFMWAMLIVLFTSISCFLCIRASIDWVYINI